MQIKRYVATSIQEAIVRVKEELGPEAVILHTHRFREGGFLGMGRRQKVEVLAGLERKPEDDGRLVEEISQLRTMVQELKENGMSARTSVTAEENELFQDDELAQILLESGICQEIVAELISDLPSENKKEVLRNRLEEKLPPIKPIETGKDRPRVVALIGPTGSGKTSTLAKLAANYTVAQQKEVGLISADTQRMAAIEQLKNYSEVIGLELEIIFTPRQLTRAIEKFGDKDLILMDTAGRNPLQDSELREMKNLLQHELIDDILLVLSVNTRYEDLLLHREKYSEINFKGYIFTKLDETRAWGNIINLAWEENRFLSFVTKGQNVPEDIELIKTRRLLDRILGE